MAQDTASVRTVLDHARIIKLRSIVRGIGLTAAARAIGVGREQCARLVGEIPAHRGTVLLAAQALDALDRDKATS